MMSVRVLVIPEDFRKDQYILAPIFGRLLRDLGRPSAKVIVCQDPLLGGVGEALKRDRIEEVVKRYRGMVDLFVLCVDRDGHEDRRARLDRLEETLGETLGETGGGTFLAENAWEELETWVLAGLKLPRGWRWSQVRAEVSVKERYFDAVVQERKLADHPGRGRQPLAKEASRRIDAIRRKCPEDFGALAKRIGDTLREEMQ